MKKKNIVTPLIRSSRAAAGINSDNELAALIGLPISTMRYRMKYPGTWKAYELRAVAKVTKMKDEVIGAIIRG